MSQQQQMNRYTDLKLKMEELQYEITRVRRKAITYEDQRKKELEIRGNDREAIETRYEQLMLSQQEYLDQLNRERERLERKLRQFEEG